MLELYCDGGVYGGNPGHAIYVSVARQLPSGDPRFYVQRQRWNQFTTNNQAEYVALLMAFEVIEHLYTTPTAPTPTRGVSVFSDSQLIVRTMDGRWRAKHKNIRRLHTLAMNRQQELRRRFAHPLNILWRPRVVIAGLLGH